MSQKSDLPVSAQEKALRRAADVRVTANFALEGMYPTAETNEDARLYIEGEMTVDEIAAMITTEVRGARDAQ